MQNIELNRDPVPDMHQLVDTIGDTTSRTEPPGDVWRAVTRGRLRVLDTFVKGQRAYLVMEAANAAPLDARSLGMLERALGGADQKAIAMDFEVSQATLTSILKRSLHNIGVPGSPSRVPLLVALLAQSSSNAMAACALRCERAAASDRTYLIVSRGLGRSSWQSLLSPAELAVVMLRAEGYSHAQIAALRRTSLRTVANQLGNAFRRLRLSGRSSLLAGFAQATLH